MRRSLAELTEIGSNVSLECRGLTKSFGGVRAVDNLSAPFEVGKVTALVGPNGAGKTTLFHLITGALKADAGDALYRSQCLKGLPPWRISRLGIGRLFQDVRVFRRLSVMENLLVSFPDQLGEQPLLTLLARPRVRRQEAERRKQALDLLKLVDLEDYHNTPAEALSYGQQKLLAIARLLAGGADVLLLDEPTAGVHPLLIERLLKVIAGLAQEGRTVIVIEHNMSVVLQIADWAYFMNEGRIVELGSPKEVLNDPEVRATYLGLSSESDAPAAEAHQRGAEAL